MPGTAQAPLLTEVQSMSAKCVAAGISVKYGKKVLSKLERVAPVRRALAAGMSEDGGGRESLEAALEQARGVKRCWRQQRKHPALCFLLPQPQSL